MRKDPKVIKAVESELPRADYADVRPVEKHAATATISAIDHCDTPLIDLAKTVEDQEIDGKRLFETYKSCAEYTPVITCSL